MVVNLDFVFGVAGVARLRDEVLKGLNSGEPSYDGCRFKRFELWVIPATYYHSSGEITPSPLVSLSRNSSSFFWVHVFENSCICTKRSLLASNLLNELEVFEYVRDLLEDELRFEVVKLWLLDDGYWTANTSALVIFPLRSLSYLDFEFEVTLFSSSPSSTPFLSKSRELK